MDGSCRRHLPLEWYPRLYGYDPYTNTTLPLPGYAGWNVEYSWNIPPDHQQRHIQHLTPYSRGVPLGSWPPPAARGRGRRRSSFPPRQHGRRGLLGPYPSSQRPPLPPPRRRAAAEESSSSQPHAPAPVQPPVPVPPPPPAASASSSAGRSPSSQTMTPPVPDAMKNSDVVDVTMTDAKDGAQDDGVLVAGSSGSSRTTKKKKRTLVPIGPPPPLLMHSDVDMSGVAGRDSVQHDDLLVAAGLSGSSSTITKKKRSVPGPKPSLLKKSDADMSGAMARGDDNQGDVLGLNVFMAKKKRLLSKNASRAVAAEEGAAVNKDSKKKSRLGWGQGLAKYEQKWSKKDGDNTHTLVNDDDASSSEPSPPPGGKGHGDHNNMAEMRISQVATTPAFSKRSSPLKGSKGHGDDNKVVETRVSQVTTTPAFCKVSCPLTASSKDHGGRTEMRASEVTTTRCKVSCPLTASKGHGDHNNMAEMKVLQVTTGPAFSKRSSPLTGSKGYGDRTSIVTKMRVSQVTTAHAFSKESSPLITGNIGDHGNGSTSRFTENVVCLDVPPGFSRKHSSSTAALGVSNSSLMSIPGNVVCSATDVLSSSQGCSTSRPPGDTGDRGSTSMNLTAEVPHAISRKGTPPQEDNSDSCIRSSTSMTAMVASELASSQECDPSPGDSSNNNENSLRPEKVVVVFAPKPRKILDKNVLSDDEEPQTYELHNENDAAPVLSGKETVTATKNYGRMNTEAEGVNNPVNQICHESTANLLAHSLPDKGHGESSMDENEHETGEVLVRESNAAPSPLGMSSSEAVSLIIPTTEAPVLENFNKDSSSIKAICTTKSSSKVKENVTQSVLIANHGDEGNCVAGGSCEQQDNMKIMALPDESCAKLANGTIKGGQNRSGAKTPEPCPSLKECNAAAKHHSWKATENMVANSNVDDGRKAPSDMKNPNSEDNPCITSDPAATLTGPAFVQHMMKEDQKMERDLQKNEDKINGKQGDNPVLRVASKECGGIQLSCKMNSHKEIAKLDSIPGPDGNDLNADTENLKRESAPCVASDAAVVIDDGLIERLGASEVMYEDKDAKVKSMEGDPAHSFASKEWSSMQSSCHVTSRKGKEKVDIIPSPEVYDLNAPSHVEMMDIDLNVPLDVTPQDVTLVDLVNSDAEATMGPNNGPGEEADSDATMEDIRPSQTIAVPQTAHRLPANQPGSIRLFGSVIYQAPSTGTTTHFPNQRNQIAFSSSNTMPSSSVVPVTRPRGGQIYPPSGATTTNSIWRSIFPNNQQGQQTVLSSNRVAHGGGSASGAAAASPLQLHQHGSNNSLVNITVQQRQQALVNMTSYSIMRGSVPSVPSNLVPGSNGGAGFVNYNGFSSVQQQWPVPVLDTSSRMMLGLGYPYPSYYFPTGATTANQAPATATASTMPSTSGTNNGEGASTSNTRAPAAAGRGSDLNSWLLLDRN